MSFPSIPIPIIAHFFTVFLQHNFWVSNLSRCHYLFVFWVWNIINGDLKTGVHVLGKKIGILEKGESLFWNFCGCTFALVLQSCTTPLKFLFNYLDIFQSYFQTARNKTDSIIYLVEPLCWVFNCKCKLSSSC